MKSLADLIRHVTVTDVTLQAVYLNRTGNVPVNKGKELTPAKVQNPPYVHVIGAKRSALYTVVMTGETTQNRQISSSLNT